ncbi:patatin-like phospholipase family protein [Acrocarpospora pleiomorpha]
MAWLGQAAAEIADRPLPAAPLAGPEPPRPIADVDLPPIGLVLAGGGAKGAYQVGAVRLLAEVGLRAAGFAGTSIGALNAAVLAGQPDLTSGAAVLAGTWREATSAAGTAMAPPGAEGVVEVGDLDQVGSLLDGLGGHVLRPGFIDALVERHVRGFLHPVWVSAFPALDPEIVGRHWAWALDGVRVAAGVRCEWIGLHERGLADARTAVLASAALPLLFPPRRLDGGVYRDGWYADNIPAGALLAHTDLDPIFVVHLSTGELWDHRDLRGRSVLEIRPSRPLTPPGRTFAALLDFTPRRFAALAALGYHDAAGVVRRWLGPRLATHRLRTTVMRAVEAVAALENHDYEM